jgi:7-carboxy-7-deazaguanine synthase
MMGDGHLGTGNLRLGCTSETFMGGLLRASEACGVPFHERTTTKTTRGTTLYLSGLRKQYHEEFWKLMEWIPDKEFARGFLAGMFDAEGHIPDSHSYYTNKDKDLVDKVVEAMETCGYESDVKYLSNSPGKIFRIHVVGDTGAQVRFLTDVNIQSEEKRTRLMERCGSRGYRTIVDISEAPDIRGYDIQTECRNFVANGMVTHNCDSMHAVDPQQVRENKTDMTPGDILWNLSQLPGNAQWIIFSGGNPCLHDLQPVVDILHNAGYYISTETQGSRWKDWLLSVDLVCISPKGPSAKMMHRLSWETLDTFHRRLTNEGGPPFFFKVPIFYRADLDFLKDVARRYTDTQVLASIGNSWAPGSQMAEETGTTDSIEEFRNVVLEHTRKVVEEILGDPVLGRVRVIPQMHTLLWGNERGR